ncbi:uncharacterized protein LOC129717595 [Wyeomyia smithii]|uniref:uncharacterized protein LOC129717595 n=1 Tax=Wyeomyia smithii TaxID=174621 RepID=UPI002467AE0F|nr:uncharacterized protein LOC129717595 [Wyeomyia smithii]
MLDGWYCRSMNEQALQQQQQHQRPQPQAHHSQAQQNRNNSLDADDLGAEDRDGGDSSGPDDDSDEEMLPRRHQINYKVQYNELKKKLKYLLYENEFFQENLRTSQRRLLKITQDRSFLLDRLLQYEKTDLTTSESEETESSDDSSKVEPAPTVGRKRKNDNAGNSQAKTAPKRRKPGPKKGSTQQARQANNSAIPPPTLMQPQQMIPAASSVQSMLVNHHQQQPQQLQAHEGHLTTEEIERHLQSRAAQSMLEVVPEGELPSEMFSQAPSSESNDHMVDTSPSNIGEECLSGDLMQQE